ncbi:hypothetical protein LTR62_005757 [Meristemomyces frigidus]|uniref:DUF7492 domain-containing protein n=1 Tax=Meristemomyces frigidus TaxID=1508187 RepID=A0AAN7TE71_9PEZI|nr:hypothetical protein LTR62_005757 [Meristemomyces frigidus]
MPSLKINMITLCALSTLNFLPVAQGHSWVEEFQVVDTNGSYIGDRGYSRGYMARTDPGYNGFSMEYLLPQTGVRISATDALCHPSQRSSNYTNPAYPKLQATPGSTVAMKYLENGHVTLPWNQLGKPAGAGTVFVYGTTQPSDNEQIADVLNWSSDGTGGNGKGFLMTAQNFDDGRCHQINCGNVSIDRQTLFPAHIAGQPDSNIEQWCETDLQIPTTVAPGTLSVYWVWQWPTEPGHDCTYPNGKDEYYTTCSDFEIIAGSGSNGDAAILVETVTTHTLAQENPQSTAVSNFQSRGAITTSPVVIMMSGTSTIGQVTTAESSFYAQCSAAGGNVAPKVNFAANCAPVSVFTGAASASAASAVAHYATTNGLAAAATATGNSSSPPTMTSGTSIPAPSMSVSNLTSAASYAASSTSSSLGTVTVTVTDMVTVLATSSQATSTSSEFTSTYSAPASSSTLISSSAYSAPASSASYPLSPSGVAAPSLSGAASGTIIFPTISTAAALPSGAVANVFVGSDNLASEHRRAHARHFR